VYLYLINYAKSNPDLAILAVNTFVMVSHTCVMGEGGGGGRWGGGREGKGGCRGAQNEGRGGGGYDVASCSMPRIGMRVSPNHV
jgi:hypothetical protein